MVFSPRGVEAPVMRASSVKKEEEEKYINNYVRDVVWFHACRDSLYQKRRSLSNSVPADAPH